MGQNRSFIVTNASAHRQLDLLPMTFHYCMKSLAGTQMGLLFIHLQAILWIKCWSTEFPCMTWLKRLPFDDERLFGTSLYIKKIKGSKTTLLLLLLEIFLLLRLGNVPCVPLSSPVLYPRQGPTSIRRHFQTSQNWFQGFFPMRGSPHLSEWRHFFKPSGHRKLQKLGSRVSFPGATNWSFTLALFPITAGRSTYYYPYTNITLSRLLLNKF